MDSHQIRQLTEKYAYKLTYSDEDHSFVATCDQFPSLSELHATAGGALYDIMETAYSCALDMDASGETLPSAPEPGSSNVKAEASLATTDPNALARTLSEAITPAVSQALATGMAQALGQALGNKMVAAGGVSEEVRILQDELYKLRQLHRELAQHALNVIVGFQIRASGRVVSIVGGFTAADLEVATSICEIIRTSREFECQGIDLATEKDANDDGIFGAVPSATTGAVDGIFTPPR